MICPRILMIMFTGKCLNQRFLISSYYFLFLSFLNQLSNLLLNSELGELVVLEILVQHLRL